MPPQVQAYTSKELSNRTWRDFEKLFRKEMAGTIVSVFTFSGLARCKKSNGCARAPSKPCGTGGRKESWSNDGRAQGILVYANGDPVGWCQDDRGEELPRNDASRNYRGLARQQGSTNLWRITCFGVARSQRRRGVGTLATFVCP